MQGEAYLREECRNDRTVSKLPAGQSPKSLGCRLVIVELDVNLPNAGRLSAAASWPGNLERHYLSVFLTFLLNVVTDFCKKKKVKSVFLFAKRLERKISHTFVIGVVHQLIGRHHVEKL